MSELTDLLQQMAVQYMQAQTPNPMTYGKSLPNSDADIRLPNGFSAGMSNPGTPDANYRLGAVLAPNLAGGELAARADFTPIDRSFGGGLAWTKRF